MGQEASLFLYKLKRFMTLKPHTYPASIKRETTLKKKAYRDAPLLEKPLWNEAFLSRTGTA